MFTQKFSYTVSVSLTFFFCLDLKLRSKNKFQMLIRPCMCSPIIRTAVRSVVQYVNRTRGPACCSFFVSMSVAAIHVFPKGIINICPSDCGADCVFISADVFSALVLFACNGVGQTSKLWQLLIKNTFSECWMLQWSFMWVMSSRCQ